MSLAIPTKKILQMSLRNKRLKYSWEEAPSIHRFSILDPEIEEK